MPVIDADTHVDENEATWAALDEGERRFAPATVVQEAALPGQPPGLNRYWLIGSQLRLRRVRDDMRTGTVQATRELTDVPARLRHMDQMGVDVHVMYPTLFLSVISGQPEIELALCKAYNRWVAARCADSGGRLRWVAVLPTLTIDRAVDEIKFARDHGAVGIMKKGVECGSRPAGDPYFYPIYEAANELDIAVCFHLGSGDPNMTDFSRNFFGMWPTVMPVIDACSSLVFNGVPDRFPRLRFGFIEAGASWVPFVLSDLAARHKRISWLQQFDFKNDLFRACRFFVAYQTQEDLPYLLQHGLEDSLVIGTDYTHADQSAEIGAIQVMRDRAARAEVAPLVVRKMLEDNPAALYGL